MTAVAFAPTRPDPLEQDLLDDIAAGLAAAEPLWRSVVVHDLEQRRPVRLLATPVYEVWVIGWTTGQHVELHDHGDAAGAVVVVEGELTERRLDGGDLRVEVLGPGDALPLPPGHVHRLGNDGVAPATSIHVYSPPLTSMTSYDPATGEPLGASLVEPEVPVLAVDASTLLRHPSTRG